MIHNLRTLSWTRIDALFANEPNPHDNLAAANGRRQGRHCVKYAFALFGSIARNSLQKL